MKRMRSTLCKSHMHHLPIFTQCESSSSLRCGFGKNSGEGKMAKAMAMAMAIYCCKWNTEWYWYDSGPRVLKTKTLERHSIAPTNKYFDADTIPLGIV